MSAGEPFLGAWGVIHLWTLKLYYILLCFSICCTFEVLHEIARRSRHKIHVLKWQCCLIGSSPAQKGFINVSQGRVWRDVSSDLNENRQWLIGSWRTNGLNVRICFVFLQMICALRVKWAKPKVLNWLAFDTQMWMFEKVPSCEIS